MIIALLEGKASLSDVKNNYLEWAIAESNIEVVKALLRAGVPYVHTALHAASVRGGDAVRLLLDNSVNVVKLLLDKGEAEVCAEDQLGRTALHWAAEKGHRDVVALLLDRNPDLIAAKDDKI